MRATSSELAVWQQRIRYRYGSIEHEMYGALESERWHTIDLEARVREQAADRRELDPKGFMMRTFDAIREAGIGL